MPAVHLNPLLSSLAVPLLRMFEQLDAALWAHLKTLCRMNGRALADQRYKKYRQIGEMRNA